MLTELRIRDLGVIDDAVLVPAPGLTALTGETGAGKTMIVSGLSLVSGAKASPSLVRHGAERAVVEARFSDVPPTLAARVEELGGSLDGDELIVARHLTGSRSRAFVGGAQVPAPMAGELAGELVTLHGQSEQIRLGSPERQREVLDRAAGPELAAVLGEYRTAWARRREAVQERDALVRDAQARARQIDLLRFGLGEIESVDPQPGEDEALAAEASRLQSADDLRLAANAAVTALAGDDTGDEPGALGLVGIARKDLDRASAADPALAALSARLAEAVYLLHDLAGDLSSYLADLEADPARLEAIAERRAALQHLTRRYGTTVDEVLAWSAAAAEELATLNAGDERIDALAEEIAQLDATLAARAGRITALRTSAADRLAADVLAELHALALPHARLLFSLTPLDELGPHGAESVALLFSANPGSEPGPLGSVASGGELSRVRLALEVVLADGEVGHTFVFDEVDAGIGGATALEIGRRLARLAERSQVLVVTHLAQVAAFADAHVVVAKASDGQVTTSGLKALSAQEREAELARMMGGLEDVRSARAHARDLLKEAGR